MERTVLLFLVQVINRSVDEVPSNPFQNHLCKISARIISSACLMTLIGKRTRRWTIFAVYKFLKFIIAEILCRFPYAKYWTFGRHWYEIMILESNSPIRVSLRDPKWCIHHTYKDNNLLLQKRSHWQNVRGQLHLKQMGVPTYSYRRIQSSLMSSFAPKNHPLFP